MVIHLHLVNGIILLRLYENGLDKLIEKDERENKVGTYFTI